MREIFPVCASQKQAILWKQGKSGLYCLFSPCVPKASPLLRDLEIISDLFFIHWIPKELNYSLWVKIFITMCQETLIPFLVFLVRTLWCKITGWIYLIITHMNAVPTMYIFRLYINKCFMKCCIHWTKIPSSPNQF